MSLHGAGPRLASNRLAHAAAPRRKLLKIDYGGAFLTLAGSVLVILPLNWGGTSFPWVSGPVLGCLIAGIVTFGVFLLWEWKLAKIPIVPRESSVSERTVTCSD